MFLGPCQTSMRELFSKNRCSVEFENAEAIPHRYFKENTA